jgi:ABC-type transporter Mla maintaining outer membrane lipid asymmetry ATPase subunit MlaF
MTPIRPQPQAVSPPLEGDAANRDARLIQLEDVAVDSGVAPGQRVLEGVNWAVARGDFWVVGGLPGSGKSQWLQVAAGLRAPAEGKLRLFGREWARTSAEEWNRLRRGVGMVFGEGGRLFGGLTVAENIGLPLCYHRDADWQSVAPEVDELMVLLGLTRWASTPPGGLNRSWRPRIALGRALALRPQVLLLDHPLGGLDPSQAHWWLGFLSSLFRDPPPFSGCPAGVVVATDDLRPWVELGRQFALLKERRCLVLGDRTRLAESREPLLRELLAPAPVVV